MADTIVDLNTPGEDTIKGGIYFGNLSPSGSFSNVPNYYTYNPSQDSKVTIELTLKKVKDNLKVQLQDQYNYTQQDLDTDDATVEKFLYDFTTLLIDYSDLRNFVFFGSAYTEIAYNINWIVVNYPYRTLVADSSTAFDEIIITNNNATNESDIVFNESTIKDSGNFNFYDSDNSFNWSNYDVVDRNGKAYSIVNAICPYSSTTIPFISNIVDGSDSILITTSAPHGFLENQSVEIFEVNGTLFSNEININANGKFKTINVTSNTFEIIDNNTGDTLVMNFTYTNGGKVRLLPLENNLRPFGFKITINGIITSDEFITYTDENNDGYTGFIISPKQKILNDFQFNLNPVQKQLLAPPPYNVTPWPRRIVTDNIQNRMNQENPNNDDIAFIQWLSNPDLFYIKDGGIIDDDIAYSDVYGEYNILRAQSLDETTTNQLIRRCIPYDAISELNDPDNGYFQRFILIAGWFFDQIYLYVKFIKFAHTLNYGEFNQLSPDYYKYYAAHYGFDLFSDDSIDFSQLVVKTEPGLYYNFSESSDPNNLYYNSTLQQLQYERQKRLLLSLFYLYRIKGTQACIKHLVSLLGAPDGLLLLQEYAFKFNNTNSLDYVNNGNYDKTLIVDNEKVHVPSYHFEIDPDYLIDKTNVNNTINQPYVYRTRLHNESTINLRQLGISTDPSQAIDNQIKNFFGKTTKDYVKFNNGEFSNLQNLNSSHFLLPLTLPDKYFGIGVSYMLTRDGYIKGVANNLEETTVHIASLIKIGATSFKNSSVVNNVIISNSNTTATITTNGNHSFLLGDKIKITGINGVININGTALIIGVPNETNIQITGIFSGTYINGGVIEPIIPFQLNAGFNTSYCLPEVFSNYDEATILTPNSKNPVSDFDILHRIYTSSNFLSPTSFEYIFIRLEGKDLVIRLKLGSEKSSLIVERVAIVENIFENDGLNHNLRCVFRPEGIEVYQDYSFVTIATWKSPITNDSAIPYLAFEIPKKDILTCNDELIPIQDLVAVSTNTGLDNPRWWDLFVGLPNNVDIYFNRIDYFENAKIDDFNIQEKIVNENNYNADTYSFDFSQYVLSSNNDVEIQSQFFKANPTNSAIDYNEILPTKLNTNSISVVDGLSLTSKNLSSNNNLNKLYLKTPQDFFADENVFERYGWQENIHKAYTYDNFDGKVIDLNNLYSPQVLTYEALLGFLDLIENKFKKTIQQFIPIVINISKFGRLIKSSQFKQAKLRYLGIHKLCIGQDLTANSSIQSKIFDEETLPVSITWEGYDPYCVQESTTTTTTTLTPTTSTTTTITTLAPTTTSTTTIVPTTTTTTTTQAPLFAKFHVVLSTGRDPRNVPIYTLTLSRISSSPVSISIRIRGQNTSAGGIIYNKGFGNANITVLTVPAGNTTLTQEGIYYTPGSNFGTIDEIQLFNVSGVINSNISPVTGDTYLFSVV